MTRRSIQIHAFCSAKGGVGKSSLGTALAKLIARRADRQVALIDADMLGTSLADGLRVCAPNVRTRADGAMDLLAAEPAGPHHSRTETSQWIRKRSQDKCDPFAPPPVFLNDILTFDPVDDFDPVEEVPECIMAPLFWKHERDDKVLYLPSSPLRRDVAVALTWLFDQANRTNPYPWIRRMSWLFQGMRAQMPNLTDIVLDLPPGLVGFTYEVLALMGTLDRDEALPIGYPQWQPEEWIAKPFLVATSDRNDLFAAMDHLLDLRSRITSLRLVLNRRTEDLDQIRGALRDRYGADSPAGNPELTSYDVSEKRDSLGRLFGARGDLEMTSDDVAELERVLGLEEEG